MTGTADIRVLTSGAPLERARAALVLLHGRGGTAEDILSLADALETPDLAYLAPQAPGNTWYPLSFLAPVEHNEPALSLALAAVAAVIDGIAQAGLPAERVVLMGFSQGGCLALEYAARNARRYGALAGLSAALIGRRELRATTWARWPQPRCCSAAAMWIATSLSGASVNPPRCWRTRRRGDRAHLSRYGPHHQRRRDRPRAADAGFPLPAPMSL